MQRNRKLSSAIRFLIGSATLLIAATVARSAFSAPALTVELPVLIGWYEGKQVYYITTDITDPVMAQGAGINYVPRLKYALRPQVPGHPSEVDRVYKFPNFEQGSVFPSAPEPAGAANSSTEYTPVWVVYMVNWVPGATPRELHSEAEITTAEEQKLVTITATNIVINCPILSYVDGRPVPGIVIHANR